jgi:tight adherence protein B
MSFLFIIILIWAVSLGAWVVLSRYVKSSDMDRLKSRLLGAPKGDKGKKKTGKSGAPGEPTVIQQMDTTKNKFAQILVDKYRLGPRLTELLEQAGLRWTPARLVNTSLMLLFVGFFVGWLMLPLGKITGIVLGLVAACLPLLFVYFKRKSRLHKFEEIFPDALEFVSRSMRAGHAFAVSLEMIHREFPEPVSSEFRRTFEEHNLGLPIDVALQKLAKRVPSLDVHFFVSAVLLQKRTGGNLAEILDKLAYIIRERFKLRGRIRAVSAHGRMTATALSCIPIAVAVLMFYTNPDYVKFFFTDDVGNIMLGAAVGLQLIGYAVMQKIVKIEV